VQRSAFLIGQSFKTATEEVDAICGPSHRRESFVQRGSDALFAASQLCHRFPCSRRSGVLNAGVAFGDAFSFLTDMGEHIEQDVAHMLIGDFVEHLLRMSDPRYQPRAAKQSQVVADERLRQLKRFGDIGDRLRGFLAMEENP